MARLISKLWAVPVLLIAVSACAKGPYEFRGKITPEVLENYLSHAVTLSEFLTVEPYCVDCNYPDKDADVHYILNTGTKFVGRAIYRWGTESILTNEDYLAKARALADRVHAADPDIIFQAAIFECVTEDVENIRIPYWTFHALGLPAEDRNFHYREMLFPDGLYVGQWGNGSVPDIRSVETQLWYMFLIGTYVNLGCEAIHLGQVYLTGAYDHVEGHEWENWDSFMKKVRSYVCPRARRELVLFDCHGGPDGVMVGERSVIDYNAFPLRIKEVEGEPMKGILEEGYSDSVYGHHIACVTPSGYRTDALPYLVEFDNFGCMPPLGEYTGNGVYIWGYDEISWFYLLPHEQKLEWLEYAYDWIAEHDPAGHLQMPGARIVTLGVGQSLIGRAVAPSDRVPTGMDIEQKVKELFSRK